MNTSKYATIDKTDLSAIVVTFTGNTDSDESFQQYLDELETCYEEKKPLGILFDASSAIIPKLKHQKEQTAWIKRHWTMIEAYCKGTAYVIPSTPIRAVLKFMLSFQKQPTPYKVLADVKSAREWLDGIVETSRI